MTDGEATDAALVQRARCGDAAAFEALVRRHYRSAFAVAMATIGDRMDAEDAVQDAFIRALERLEECREPDRFKGWLMTIVRNRAHNLRDYLRLRSGPPVEEGAHADRAWTSEGVEARELRVTLEGALATLTPIQREVVLLHDLDGWKHRAIAESLGISEEMSRQHVFVARRKLREQLGPDAIEEHLR